MTSCSLAVRTMCACAQRGFQGALLSGRAAGGLGEPSAPFNSSNVNIMPFEKLPVPLFAVSAVLHTLFPTIHVGNFGEAVCRATHKT